MNKIKVSVFQVSESGYPNQFPYNPSVNYPEYPFKKHLSVDANQVYAGVRHLFKLLDLDKDHYNSPGWNPLGYLVKPGMTVLLKPNFVLSRHNEGKNLFSIITHPSVLRVIADYVWIALKRQGNIIIADSPQYDCNFQELLTETKLDKIIAFYEGFNGPKVNLYDLRSYWSRGKHFSSLLEPLRGDPQGTMIVNLGEKSALEGKLHPEKLYGAVYNRNETISHHTGGKHEYELSKTVLNADVIISVPKLKVHKKVGVTLNVKGLVGITTNKNFLVHYSVTSPREGGDQYPDDLFTPIEEAIIKTERWMYDHFLANRKCFWEYLHRTIYAIHNNTTRLLGLKVKESKRQLDAGNWYGNDSAWRMAVDLMKIFIFTDHNGSLKETPQRKTLSIIDGIIGGEKSGPLVPDPKLSGVLLCGENYLAVDIVATRLMGFDPLKLKMYSYLLKSGIFGFCSPSDIEILSNNSRWQKCLLDSQDPFLSYKPHSGWVGHIEINK